MHFVKVVTIECIQCCICFGGFSGGLVVKNPSTNAGEARDMGLIPGSQRFPGGGNGNTLQYSCLENPMDRETWQAIVHGAAKSQTRLST